MIGEAFDTLFALGWAVLAWLVLLAAVASLALWTVAVTVAFACRTLWRGVAAVLAAVQRSSVPEAPPTPPVAPERRTDRPAPSWARTEHEDAA